MKICSYCHRCRGDEAVECIEEGHPLLSETRPGDPEMIAGYRLEVLLASAAKSDTYLARQIECGRSCRIKIVSAGQAGDLLREAELAAAVFHPNVADVYEAGQLESGEVFVVAEETGCGTLRERLDSGPALDLLTSILIVRQAAEALHELHQKGLIHRAVRPESIVLAEDADGGLLVKVQDPDLGGLAQRSIISNKFLIDSALDSLRYFAPEQCSGEEVTARTDVYALGVVFYEMLAGRPPFDAPNAAGLIAKHKTQPPPDVKIDNFDLRMLVTHALTESLQKQPRLRQSSANLLARQLRHIEQLANHISTPPPIGIVPPAPPRTKPRVAVEIDAATSASVAPVVTKRTQITVRAEPKPEAAVERSEKAPKASFDLASDIPIPPPVEELESTPIELEILVEAPPEITETPREIVEMPFEKPMADDAGDASETAKPRRSRMKFQRKRTHSKIAAAAFRPEEKASPPAVEPERMPAVLHDAPAAETTAERAIAQAAAAATPRRQPKLIQWDQPEDDIPSVEDVLEVLREENIAASAAAEAMMRETAVPADPAGIESEPEPISIEPERIAAVPVTAPAREEVVPAPAPLAVETAATEMRVFAKPDAAIPASGAVNLAAAFDEPEEITLVRPVGERIRIDLDQPAPKRWKKFSAGSAQPSFVPTLLGDGRHGAIDPDVRDSMFSDFYGKRHRRLVTARRVTALGGFVALIAAFLFGDDIATIYQQARSSDSSASSLPPPAAEPAAPARKIKPSPPARKNARQNLAEPRPAKAENRTTPAGEPETSRSRPKAEPAKKNADGKKTQPRPEPAGATRPRIVKP